MFFTVGTYFIDMQMKMFLWVLGLLVLMLSTSMTEAFAVGLLQVSASQYILPVSELYTVESR